MDEEKFKGILSRIEFVLMNKEEVDLPYELKSIGDYYEFLALNLSRRNKLQNIPYELVSLFESVNLTMLDYLEYYPGNIKNQVTEIVEKNQLCEFFAEVSIVAAQSDGYQSLIYQPRSPFEIFARAFTFRPFEDDTQLSNNRILKVKTALTRLAQIIKYSSAKETHYIRSDFNEFQEHFNFELIDKEKVVALISLLKSELKTKDAKDLRIQKLIDKVDSVEREVRKKSRINWSCVVTTIFVVYGFLADFKTLSPNQYDRAHKIAEQIMQVLHYEPQVDKSNNINPFGDSENNEYPMKQVGTLPSELRREDED